MSIWDTLETRVAKGKWNKVSGSKKQEELGTAARNLTFFANEGGFTPKRRGRK